MTNAITLTALVFDCDGVLLDSNDMKCDAFREVVSSYPSEVTEPFLAFQRRSFGMSRYRLIDAFFSDFLHRTPKPGERDRLLTAFGEACVTLYPRQAVTEGTLAALATFKAAGLPMFIASGSDEVELRMVMAGSPIGAYMSAIYGSPRTKVENLKTIQSSLPVDAQIVFVGDAEADWKAAEATGAAFYYMSPYAAAPDVMSALKAQHGFPEIHSLADLAPNIDGARQTGPG